MFGVALAHCKRLDNPLGESPAGFAFLGCAMGRLTTAAPRLQQMRSRLSAANEGMSRSQKRDADQPWRKWYKTAAWQRLRLSVLERDMFTCQMVECGKFVADTSQLVADHRKPHRGDHDLFWDLDNLQCLCKACHDSLKQREERGGSR